MQQFSPAIEAQFVRKQNKCTGIFQLFLGFRGFVNDSERGKINVSKLDKNENGLIILRNLRYLVEGLEGC